MSSSNLVRELIDSAKAFLDDEWRATIDWGPSDERDAIRQRLARAVAACNATYKKARDKRRKIEKRRATSNPKGNVP
jgi:hypothetical protein